jgi:hypothetical protein
VSVQSHFIHICDTERFTSVGKDGLRAEKRDWQALEQNMRCRFVVKEQRVADSVFAERLTLTTYVLLFGPGKDIKTKDRIVNIRFEDGTTDDGPYTIDAILPRRARSVRHQSARLTKGTTR